MEVTLVKWQQCGKYHSSGRWYTGPNFRDAPLKRTKEDVYILALDAELSHGLDLSFVTHMFLLEPIDDAALLEQVTARAHRLGAKGPVSVETIHVFYKCSDSFQKLIFEDPDRKKNLQNIVCHHCYRQFGSHELAEKHEQTMCPRNVESSAVLDNKWMIGSVYREIRPPLPVVASSPSVRSGNNVKDPISA
jgi:hypothetical protein